ncbi:cystatin-like [Dreissena polymorpha]|uniref:Cystatin domain-containing protein n=1 Tax=Dreissena polymorpha TaxID=45954 RepID=A0A9D3Y2E8_DREPO|nr:cystatin-like [Dreissena polymorpha]KAH3691387.1 hypothetical protein DPMN_194021 [Dreissena polymorpha]
MMTYMFVMPIEQHRKMMNTKTVIALCLVLGLCHSRRLLGGRKTVSVNDPKVQEIAAWASSELNGSLVAVSRAQTQVVAGVRYYLTIQLSVITGNANETLTCSVKVLDKAWIEIPGPRVFHMLK